MPCEAREVALGIKALAIWVHFWKSHGGRRETSPTNCPLNSMSCAPRDAYIIHTVTNTMRKKHGKNLKMLCTFKFLWTVHKHKKKQSPGRLEIINFSKTLSLEISVKKHPMTINNYSHFQYFHRLENRERHSSMERVWWFHALQVYQILHTLKVKGEEEVKDF